MLKKAATFLCSAKLIGRSVRYRSVIHNKLSSLTE